MRRRNLAESCPELWRPPPLSPNQNGLSRLADGLRRFLDLQAGSVWRDLGPDLSSVSGTLLDVGCGGQPYRALVPAGVTYKGIDTADAKERFGYGLPDTEYFSGDVWPVEDGAADMVRNVLGSPRARSGPGTVHGRGVPLPQAWRAAPYDSPFRGTLALYTV